MDDLPNELLYPVCLDLSLPDLLSLGLTCSRFAEFLRDDAFWQKKTQHDFPDEMNGFLCYELLCNLPYSDYVDMSTWKHYYFSISSQPFYEVPLIENRKHIGSIFMDDTICSEELQTHVESKLNRTVHVHYYKFKYDNPQQHFKGRSIMWDYDDSEILHIYPEITTMTRPVRVKFIKITERKPFGSIYLPEGDSAYMRRFQPIPFNPRWERFETPEGLQCGLVKFRLSPAQMMTINLINDVVPCGMLYSDVGSGKTYIANYLRKMHLGKPTSDPPRKLIQSNQVSTPTTLRLADVIPIRRPSRTSQTTIYKKVQKIQKRPIFQSKYRKSHR